MVIIIEIARVQLAKLFYSPIAWLILIILLIQAGYTFTDQIEFYETQQRKNFPFPLLTEKIITATASVRPGVIYSVAKNLYLYLPLLTMGLISVELSSGTIKLLYSSPISVRQLVLGKFLAIVTFSFLFILCLCLFILSGYFIIDDFDLNLIIS